MAMEGSFIDLLDELYQLFDDKYPAEESEVNSLLMNKNRLMTLERNVSRNVITHENAEVTRAQISQAIFDFLQNHKNRLQ